MPLQAFGVFRQAALLHGAFQQQPQRRRLDGLLQEPERAQIVDDGDGSLQAPVRGQHNRLRPASGGPQPLQKFRAIHARHF